MPRELPNRLRIVDGELVLDDGGDVRQYLREFAELAKVTPDTPLVLMRRDGAEKDRTAATMMRCWAS